MLMLVRISAAPWALGLTLPKIAKLLCWWGQMGILILSVQMLFKAVWLFSIFSWNGAIRRLHPLETRQTCVVRPTWTMLTLNSPTLFSAEPARIFFSYLFFWLIFTTFCWELLLIFNDGFVVLPSQYKGLRSQSFSFTFQTFSTR